MASDLGLPACAEGAPGAACWTGAAGGAGACPFAAEHAARKTPTITVLLKSLIGVATPQFWFFFDPRRRLRHVINADAGRGLTNCSVRPSCRRAFRHRGAPDSATYSMQPKVPFNTSSNHVCAALYRGTHDPSRSCIQSEGPRCERRLPSIGACVASEFRVSRTASGRDFERSHCQAMSRWPKRSLHPPKTLATIAMSNQTSDRRLWPGEPWARRSAARGDGRKLSAGRQLMRIAME